MSNYVNLLDIVYPIGSIIASYSSTSPASWVGGTWTNMQGFLYGSTSNVGATGGSSIHSHGLAGTGYARIGATGNNPNSLGYAPISAGDMGAITSYTVYGTSYTSEQRYVNHWTHLAGNTNTVETLPPYTTVHYYRRTA